MKPGPKQKAQIKKLKECLKEMPNFLIFSSDGKTAFTYWDVQDEQTAKALVGGIQDAIDKNEELFTIFRVVLANIDKKRFDALNIEVK